jgi:hypothetical protein
MVYLPFDVTSLSHSQSGMARILFWDWCHSSFIGFTLEVVADAGGDERFGGG